jgi:hypothetical protein
MMNPLKHKSYEARQKLTRNSKNQARQAQGEKGFRERNDALIKPDAPLKLKLTT